MPDSQIKIPEFCRMVVRMTGVLGDQEDFADLIGTQGSLGPGDEGFVYLPERRGDHLAMAARKYHYDGKGKITIETKLGNTFIFEVLEYPFEREPDV